MVISVESKSAHSRQYRQYSNNNNNNNQLQKQLQQLKLREQRSQRNFCANWRRCYPTGWRWCVALVWTCLVLHPATAWQHMLPLPLLMLKLPACCGVRLRENRGAHASLLLGASAP